MLLTKNLDALKKELLKASTMGLNKAGAKVVTELKRKIRETVNIKLAKLSDVISLRKANKNDLRIDIKIKQDAIGLVYFGARQTRSGVAYAITKGGRQQMRSAFISSIGGYGSQVYRREGSTERRQIKRGRYAGKMLKRQIIRKQAGKSVAQMMLGKSGNDMITAIKKVFLDESQKEINKALDYLRK